MDSIQNNNFNGGLNSDLDVNNLNPNLYRDALNMELVEGGSTYALTNLKGDTFLYAFPLTVANNPLFPVDKETNLIENIVATFAVKGTWAELDLDQPNNVFDEVESMVIFTRYDNGNRIYLMRSDNNFISKIYEGELDIQTTDALDAKMVSLDISYHLYWTDNRNAPRKIKLQAVANAYNCTFVSPARSPQWFPTINTTNNCQNHPDVLSVRRLFPVSEHEIVETIVGSGVIPFGTFQYAYRYYNSKLNKYSTFSLFTQPYAITYGRTASQGLLNSIGSNEVRGGVAGGRSNKAMQLRIAAPPPSINDYAFTAYFYDCIQIAVIFNSANSLQNPQKVFITEPNSMYYNLVAVNQDILFTGNERLTEVAIEESTIDDSPIQTAKTLEEADGRLILANVKYYLNAPDFQLNDCFAYEKKLRINIDPMIECISMPNNEAGYYSEKNAYKFRGYFRGELYRFGVTYVNKYGDWSYAKQIDFTNYNRQNKLNAVQTPIQVQFGVMANHQITSTYIDNNKLFVVISADSFTTNIGTFRGEFHFSVEDNPPTQQIWYIEDAYLYDNENGDCYHFDFTTASSYVIASQPTNVGDFVQLITFITLSFNKTDHFKNWSDADAPDFKFIPRNEPFGKIVNRDNETDYLKALGLKLKAFILYNEDAVAFDVVRLQRKKNILGQSVLMNQVVYQGVPSQRVNLRRNYPYFGTLSVFPPDVKEIKDYREVPLTGRYNGEEDTFGDRILAHGNAKSLIAVTQRLLKFNVVWLDNLTTEAQRVAISSNILSPNIYTIYPLEYELNDSISRDKTTLADNESLEIVDAVMLCKIDVYYKVPNILGNWGATAGTDFEKGAYSEYAFLYTTRKPTSYIGNASALNNVDAAAIDGGTNQVNVREKMYLNGGYFPMRMAQENIYSPVSPVFSMQIKDGYKVDIKGVPIVITGKVFIYKHEWEENSLDTSNFAPSFVTTRFIQHLNNEDKLCQKSVIDTINADEEGTNLFRTTDIAPNFDLYNQRSISVITEKDSEKQISPVRITNALFFGQLQNDGSQQDGYPTADMSDIFDTNKLNQGEINMPFYVVNIVAGLNDKRYGVYSGSDVYISTGKYTKLNKADRTTEHDIEVFGGDCFITRATIKVRDNAVRKDGMGTNKIEYKNGEGKDQVTAIGQTEQIRTTSYKKFVEYVDMWTESENNGHWQSFYENHYPSGVKERADANSNSDLCYPPREGADNYNNPNIYQYHNGNSFENTPKIFVSNNEIYNQKANLRTRIVWSNQRINNSSILGYDKFSANDYYDNLSESYGGITKIIRMSDEVIVAIQDSAVANLGISRTLAYDPQGNLLNLSSAKVISSSRYTSTNAGSKYIRSIKKNKEEVYFIDTRTNIVYKTTGGTPNDISTNIVEELVNSIFPENFAGIQVTDSSLLDNEIIGLMETKNEKYTIYNNSLIIDGVTPNDPLGGLTYNANLNKWESRFNPFVCGIAKMQNILHIGHIHTFAATNSELGTLAKVYKTNTLGSIRDSILGYPKISYVEIQLNQQKNTSRTYDVIKIHATNLQVDTDIDTAEMLTFNYNGQLDQQAILVQFVKNREDLYLANKFRDELSRARMRGLYANLIIHIGNEVLQQGEPEPVIIRNVQSVQRLSFRQK